MIERFEDLIAWRKARALNRKIYAVTTAPPLSRDFSLRDQIRAASISVMANVAEGFERFTQREFARFLGIAKASCAELRSHLYAAADVEYVDTATFAALLEEAEDVAATIGSLRAEVSRRARRAELKSTGGEPRARRAVPQHSAPST